jgi:hypothetical protein
MFPSWLFLLTNNRCKVYVAIEHNVIMGIEEQNYSITSIFSFL